MVSRESSALIDSPLTTTSARSPCATSSAIGDPTARDCTPDDHAALAHRRLSIVDLAGGHQPLSNETGDIWVTFNGEIYNHADVRPHLEAAGHTYLHAPIRRPSSMPTSNGAMTACTGSAACSRSASGISASDGCSWFAIASV